MLDSGVCNDYLQWLKLGDDHCLDVEILALNLLHVWKNAEFRFLFELGYQLHKGFAELCHFTRIRHLRDNGGPPDPATTGN